MNLPSAFVKRIQEQFANNADDFINALTNEPKTSIRYNRAKTSKVENNLIPWAKDAYFLEMRPSFTLDPLFHAGYYYVQEASSMLIEQVFQQYLNTDSAMRILDICAAPGGKSTHIMSLINEQSYLVSNEIISNRSNILMENIIKWGMGNALVTNSDPSKFAYLKNHFDLILVDAPCSGEGLFRKNPDACAEWSEKNCAICVHRQRDIFRTMWECLKEGGIMIYSTCTYNPEENERNLAALQEEFNFDVLPLALKEEWQIQEVKFNSILGYQFLPHKSKGEGFYLSIIQKPGILVHKEGKIKNRNHLFKSFLNESSADKFDVKHVHNRDYFMPNNMSDDFDAYKSLHIKHAGVCIGEEINKKLIPDHSLALFAGLNASSFPRIDLEEKSALNYLAKRDFAIDGPLGWNIVTFENAPLGFIKNMGNRFNNYYPNEWKIRMNF